MSNPSHTQHHHMSRRIETLLNTPNLKQIPASGFAKAKKNQNQNRKKRAFKHIYSKIIIIF